MKSGRFRPGLKLKGAVLLALLLATVLAVLSALVLAGIRKDQRTELEQSFARLADAANLRVRQEYLTVETTDTAAFMSRNGQRLAIDLGEQSGMAVTLYDNDGAFVGTSLPIQSRADVSDALTYTARGQAAYITEGDQLLYLAPLYGGDQRLGSVQFHASLADQHAFYESIRRLFLLTGAAVLAGGFLLGYYYVRRQVSVIDRLNAAAQQIGQGDYLTKPSVRRGDEFGELAVGIYDMSEKIARSVRQLTKEQEKLLATIARLQELEQQQKQFIGNISHELKTPLTSILAYADLLEMYRDDPALLEQAGGRIRDDAERLYALVEKALQLSAMDVYEFETHAESVPLRPLLENAARRMQAKAAAAGVDLETDLVDGTVWADPDNVMHMALNLLDNAIKYNRAGGAVTLSNRTETRDGARPAAVISVSDTGIGIPPEAQSRIFDPFYTVSADRSRASGGTGLGLALVRSLAEKQGGNVRLAASGPDGSRFELVLPAERPGE
ncbi:cell wall metabolism sensor histidine kinase WalK [Cohnella sp. REN36]|uniref:sensor histidine kinase n=1 Tax=Cohnella sp. REN36 TaxID=2887347 RepID=UPI001D15E2B0|nr:HAMP domain-containing sensor histidine kinase [Cohnella sp. REN36]MCC3375415.1 HAMP domain-containing histidine kinase [Cohnella sp. REN36]